MHIPSLRKDKNYFLHSVLGKNKKTVFYYFSGKQEGEIDLPSGYEIEFNKKTGLPYLKKK